MPAVEIVGFSIHGLAYEIAPETRPAICITQLPCLRTTTSFDCNLPKQMITEQLILNLRLTTIQYAAERLRFRQIEILSFEKGIDSVGDFDTAIRYQQKCLTHTAFRSLEQCLRYSISLHSDTGTDMCQGIRQPSIVKWLEADALATRPDCREQASRRMGNQDKERPCRRLFQGFQECIGGIAIHIIGRVDNNDAPSVV